jgi:flagellar hook assembly protein FlgD
MLVDMKAVGQYAFTFADNKQFKVIYSRDGELKPGLTMLGQSYPNPFQAGVSIPIMLDASQSRLQIQVYDLWGRRVRTLNRDAVEAGTVVFTWDGRTDDGREVDSGLYLYQLVGDTGVLGSPKRMIKQ